MTSTTSQDRESVPPPARKQSSSLDASTAKIVILTLSVFLGPWCVWWSRIAEGRGWIDWHLPLGVALWSITPILFLAVAATSGRAGISDLGHRLVRWRVPGRCYLFAMLLPPVIAALTASIAGLAGVTVELGDVLSASGAAIYFTYGVGLFLLTEEAGWRGVVLPRLQARMAPLTASLLLGVIWAVWHIPSLHIPGETDEGLSLPVFAVLVISTSVLVTALVNASSGSVLIAALFHASFDASYAFTGVVGGDRALLVIAAVLTAICAVSVSVRTQGRLFTVKTKLLARARMPETGAEIAPDRAAGRNARCRTGPRPDGRGRGHCHDTSGAAVGRGLRRGGHKRARRLSCGSLGSVSVFCHQFCGHLRVLDSPRCRVPPDRERPHGGSNPATVELVVAAADRLPSFSYRSGWTRSEYDICSAIHRDDDGSLRAHLRHRDSDRPHGGAISAYRVGMADHRGIRAVHIVERRECRPGDVGPS